jgi:hypothetical protein
MSALDGSCLLQKLYCLTELITIHINISLRGVDIKAVVFENGGGILGHSSVGIKRSRAAKKSATFAFSVLGRAWGYLLWNCI